MKILLINWEDPGVFETVEEAAITQEQMELHDQSSIDLVKFDKGDYHRAVVDSEEDEDTQETTFSISGWEKL